MGACGEEVDLLLQRSEEMDEIRTLPDDLLDRKDYAWDEVVSYGLGGEDQVENGDGACKDEALDWPSDDVDCHLVLMEDILDLLAFDPHLADHHSPPGHLNLVPTGQPEDYSTPS